MTIAITGATGQLGRLVIAQLKAKVPASSIVALARNPDNAAQLGVEVREADYDRPETLAEALAGIDTLLLILCITLRSIADQHVHDIGDSARLFALASLAAAADAAITAWDSKYAYSFWRPLRAIREGDSDGNSQTIGDAMWEPLINTPNYPEHTSGANNLTGAMTRTLALFFGTDMFTFKVTSLFPGAPQKERQYTRLSDMAQDMVDVRIYQGIHFRTADEVGRRQGRRVARWVFKRFLRPVDDDHDDCGDDDDDDDHDDR